jgi:hypothetical protein
MMMKFMCRKHFEQYSCTDEIQGTRRGADEEARLERGCGAEMTVCKCLGHFPRVGDFSRMEGGC